MRFLLKIAVAALFLFARNASADGSITPQLHPFSACAERDKACVMAWFAEYRNGILEEFSAYEKIASSAQRIAADGDDMAAARLSGELIREGWYRHNHWDLPKDPAIALAAGISFDDLDAVITDCRDSILDMKYFLIAASNKTYDSQGWQDWVDDSKKCRAFQGRKNKVHLGSKNNRCAAPGGARCFVD